VSRVDPARDDLSHPLHQPVLVAEVLEHLFAGTVAVERRLVVDATVGLGGHAEAILEARPEVVLLGIDRDPGAIARAAQRLGRFGARVALVHASYADLATVLADRGEAAPLGVLLDLGASSWQFDDPERGFSFREGRAGADMRFDPTGGGPTALDLVNGLSERELAETLHEFGEEPRARAVARRIVRARPIRDGAHLAEVVRGAALRTRRHDPATRTFQALRIAVNREFEHLESGLAVALEVTAPGARIVAISFHSGEDRRVKEAFRRAVRSGRGRLRTRKPVRPSDEEIRRNRRAKAARLRVFERGEASGGMRGEGEKVAVEVTESGRSDGAGGEDGEA
jgi:16S rRNA (cytosine1402-N4)-methyltransferase